MQLLKTLDERPVVLHQGTFKPSATTGEAVYMMTGMAIGAGILGLPYAIAKVGLGPGVLYMAVLGCIVLALNLMVGEMATLAGEPMQLPGFAGKFLGRAAKAFVSVTIVLRSLGALLAYMLGVGTILRALLGGNQAAWSIIFWSIGSFLIWGGLERIKKVERIFSLTVMGIIILLSLYMLPHGKFDLFTTVQGAEWLYPFGVILFAFNATPAIAEAYALLPNKREQFRKAVLIGTLVPVAIFILFTVAVVGVFGAATPQIATVGLGARFGLGALWFANIFALLAMSNCFMGLGTALKETLVWDHGFSKPIAKIVVLATPLVLFLVGARSFVLILEVVGGIFISSEAVILALAFWRAHQTRKDKSYSFVRHAVFATVPVLLGFVFVTAISLYRFTFGR